MSALYWLRVTWRGPWTVGEIIAATVVVAIGVPVIGSILATIGDAGVQFATWGWAEIGGNSLDTTQASMARAAWAGVIVGVVTIVLLGVTLAFTSIATRISLLSVQQAQDLGRAQVRAYVGAHDLSFEFPGGEDFSVSPKVSIGISNTGQTPARRVRMKMGWQNARPRQLLSVDHSAGYSVLELGANHSTVERIPCWDFKEDILMDHVVGAASSYIQGVIEYEDVFGEDHQTWFRFKVSGDYQDAVPMLYAEQTQDGNLST